MKISTGRYEYKKFNSIFGIKNLTATDITMGFLVKHLNRIQFYIYNCPNDIKQ